MRWDSSTCLLSRTSKCHTSVPQPLVTCSMFRSLVAVDSDGYLYKYFPCEPRNLGADSGTCDIENHVAVSWPRSEAKLKKV